MLQKLGENNDVSGSKECTALYSNSKAVNTHEEPFRALVDWVTVTFKNVEKYQKIIELLGLKEESFRQVDVGMKHYKKHMRYGHIAIYFDSDDGYGTRLDISGQGCREFETFSEMSWSQLFFDILGLHGKFTRLDVAIDDFSELLKMKTMVRKVKDGAVRSRFQTAKGITKYELKTGTSKGDTLYFGAPSSRMQIRFYDKFLERTSKGFDMPEGIKSWTRVEIQARKDNAISIAHTIAYDSRSLGHTVRGILRQYITFCVPSKTDTNKSRWKVAKFWDMFLDNAEKLPLSQSAPDLSIQRSKEWIVRQTTATLAMLFTAYDGDISQMMNLLIDGTNKMDEKHLDIINRFRLDHEQETLSLEEYYDTLNENVYDLIEITRQMKKRPEIG